MDTSVYLWQKDIQILHVFLKSRNDDLHNQLNSVADKYGFQELAEITLVRTLILNRRRVGKIQFMLLSDFIKAKSADPNSDVFQVLSSAEQELSKLLKRLVIKGKKGRGVPVLLTEDSQSSLDLLIELRDSCEINSDNPYLFPARTTAGHFRAHVLLKKYANIDGCEFVDSITSTRLRKHIATMTQLLNLKDHELDSLAKFMGHDIRVHRLSDGTTQLAKISKLLISLDKGDFNRLKGKNLDEIDIDDFVQDRDESESDSDEEDSHQEILVVPENNDPASNIAAVNPPTEKTSIMSLPNERRYKI
ncbi:hypothetical protein JTB14_015819 [Gonioctena quinquepunctata]|nr:hypothetical protein JTB14_015819 [Gonioctena quinquepunctata]